MFGAIQWRSFSVGKMYADFFKIKIGDILLFGITHKPFGEHKFMDGVR